MNTAKKILPKIDNGYSEFISQKAQYSGFDGFEVDTLPDYLFGFQKELTRWALMIGRGAIFADCGLGKTAIQLAWAWEVFCKTGKPVLIITPLAVSQQTIKEAEKFGVEAVRSLNGVATNGINVTNYEKLHLFNTSDYVGAVCDESSILKNFSGARKKQITQFMKKMKYRLLCTATAAPNDYIELGTSSEALGYMGYTDMLGKFFKNDQNSIDTSRSRRFDNAKAMFDGKWRFKGHAEIHFWKWVTSWARSIRYPSDIGFSDDGYILPDLTEREHLVECEQLRDGYLFPLPAFGLKEQREERRLTIKDRCEKVAKLVDHNEPALVWCHLNDEGDFLERIIPDAVQVAGKDTDEAKEKKFIDFAEGRTRVLVTKPKIGALGLNFQHCNHVTFFPSHSFEQYYQGVRRCWRFGQEKPVTVDIVTTEGEIDVLKNLQRKQIQSAKMFTNLVRYMDQSLKTNNIQTLNQPEVIPKWL